MVINEKALVREMKESFKGWGYEVIMRHDGRTAITNHYWAVVMDNYNVPREALSLMALHMGFLPEEGDAYRVYKGDGEPVVQKKLLEEALAPILKLEDQTALPLNSLQSIVKTALTYDGYNVWQMKADGQILLIDPSYEAILAEKKGNRRVGDTLCAEGGVSKVYICKVDKKSDEAKLEHLAQMQWVAT